MGVNMNWELTPSQYAYAWELYRRWRRANQQWFDDRLWTRACASARVLLSDGSDDLGAMRVRGVLKNGRVKR